MVKVGGAKKENRGNLYPTCCGQFTVTAHSLSLW